jgi:hypothetical protein
MLATSRTQPPPVSIVNSKVEVNSGLKPVINFVPGMSQTFWAAPCGEEAAFPYHGALLGA